MILWLFVRRRIISKTLSLQSRIAYVAVKLIHALIWFVDVTFRINVH